MQIDFTPTPYQSFPRITDKQIEAETLRIWEFLQKTPPYIEQTKQAEYGFVDNMDLAIEIRPLRYAPTEECISVM